MVAIVSGNSLGLFNTSASLLGSAGILGQGWLGQANGRSYVNAATGNLILQFQDEQLSGRGADLLHLRTYNSRGQIVNGQFTDGDGDGWRWDGERTVKFDAAQDTVIRTAGDGSETRYTRSGSVYVSTDGDGAHDVIRREGTQWVWTDGTSRQEERYSDSTSLTMIGRLQSQKDTSGNLIDFEYSNNRLFRITDHDSRQRIQLTYATVAGGFTRLTQVDTFELIVDGTGRATGTVSTTPIKQVEYTYNAGRLETVKTVLDPSASPLAYYTTTYGYADATTKNIASITQSDGTRVDFEYHADGRVKSVTDGSGKQSFTYHANSTDITYTAADGSGAALTWTYTYDPATQQLLKIESPAPAAGGARLVTRFEYESASDGAGHAGNVKRIIDARGNEVIYKYDAQCNRISERDALGSTITRTYNSNNQLETESRYKSVDTNFNDNLPPSDPLTTRYVYDEQSRLRFLISAEGRVQEYRYGTGTGAFGLLTRTIQYAGGRFEVGTLSATQVPTQAQMVSWAAGQDKTQVQQTQYVYDFRGNLATRTAFATVNSAGEGVLDAAATVTDSIYDGHGRLVHTIARRGVNRTDLTLLTSYVYDGLGRVTSEVNAGVTRNTVYNGIDRTIQVTNTASGLVETRTFDAVGRLSSVQLSDGEPVQDNPSVRSTQYVYDAFGRLRMVQDALGNRHFSFYDDVGRLLHQVGSTGAACSYEYNANGQMISQTCYVKQIEAEVMSGWVNEDGTVEPSTLSVGASGTDILTDAEDRVTRYVYDAAGRLTDRIDAIGTVATTTYDGASRLTTQQSGNRVTRYFYDRDGKQVGVVDALGYLTEHKYDAAGRLVESVRYSTRSASASNVAAPVWVGITDQTAVGGRGFTYRMPAFGDALDADSFSVVGSKPSWITVTTDAHGVTLSGTPPKTLTSYALTLSAADGRGQSTEVTVTITVANTAPKWEELSNSRVAVNTPGYSLSLPAASDNETGTLTYSINAALLPPGLTFNAGTRTISGVPTTPGTYSIIARVTDGQGLFTEQTFTVRVTNKGPSWPALDEDHQLPPARLNVPYSASVPAALEPDGEALTYSAILLPSWLHFDPVTLRLSGTPTEFGSYPVVLEARDPHGDLAPLSFTVTVANSVPTWTSLPPINETAGSTIDHPLPAAVDTDGEALTYTVVSGLPPGLVVDAATGRISGISNAVGPFHLILLASDSRGGSVQRSVSIQLRNALPVYHGGIPATQTVVGGDGPLVHIPAGMFTDANDTLSFTISATLNGNNVPSWLHLENQAGGNRVFTGTAPASVTSRTYRFTIIASDPHGGSVIATFAIEVLPADDDQLVSGEAPDAVAGPPVAQVALPPLEDVLSSVRPATSAGDLHSYQYYDAQGRLVGSVDERGFLSETVHDEQANTQHRVRYMNAVTVGATDTLANLRDRAGTSKTSTTEYDGVGRVSRRIGVDGTQTRHEYDSAGRLVREVRAADTDEARGSRIRYNAFGEITGTVGGEGDAAGLSTDAAIAQYGLSSEYDSLGRRIRTIDANGGITLFYYDSAGRLTYTVNARGEVSESLYTAFGQLETMRRYFTRLPEEVLTTLQALGGGPVNEVLLSALGEHSIPDKDQLTSYAYDTRGLLEKSTDAEGFTTTHTYTAFGELATQERTIVQAKDGAPARTVTTQFDYDLRGQLLSQTADVSRLNFNTQSVYDAFGRVIESVDGAGKVTRTNYSKDSGRTIEVTDALNRTLRTEYDAFARVLKVIDASQHSTTYFYDDTARSVAITTPEGVTVTTTKTRHGETLTVLDGRGHTTQYEYNKDGQLKTVTDGLGHVVTENTYDESGLLIETKDARGIVTRLSYDEMNRLFTRRVDPTGLNLVTTYQVTAFGQVLTQTEGVGNNLGDNVTRVTRYKYDRKGQLTQVITDPDVEQTGYVGMNLTTTYEYDGVGNTIEVKRGTVDQPDQQVTLYEFDALNRRVKEIAAPSAVFGAGSPRTRDLTTEYRYDAAGRVSRRLDANGASTWFVYDAAGQQTQVINALGEVSERFYDENGRLVRTHRYFNRLSAPALASLGDVASAVTLAVNQDDQRARLVYDKDGRQRYTLHNSRALNWTISENRYDGNGNLIEARRYDKVLADARVNAISAGGITPAKVTSELATLGYTEADNTLSLIQRTRHAYDAANRLRFTVDALGSVSESVYDKAGNRVSQVRYEQRPTLASFTDTAISAVVNRGNVKNQVSHFIHDAAGRLRYSVQVAGSTAQGALTHRVSRNTYDAVGRVVRTDAYATAMTLSNYTQATLDAAVALSGNKSAQDRTRAFAYDPGGRQVYSVQVAGTVAGETRHIVTQQVHDSVGQVVRSTTYAKTMTLADYEFETLDTQVALSANHSAQDRTTGFAYDPAGRQMYSAQVAGFNEAGEALHVVSLRVYNALDQVVTSTTHARTMRLADYALETLDAAISDEENHSAQDRTTAFAYDLEGRQCFVVAADGSLSETVYNRLGQVGERRQFDLRVSVPTAATRYKEADLISARGTREVGDGVTRGEKYSYDREGRLLTTTDAKGFLESYSYDTFGNRRERIDKNGNKWTYTYDTVGRLSTQVTPKVFVRLGGETVERSLTTLMEYDALDNLVTRTEASGTADARVTSYSYNPQGQQILITQPGHYVPVSDAAGSGTVVKVEGGVTPPAGSFQRTLETHYDALGNAVRTRLRTGADSYQYEYKTYDEQGRIVHDIDALNQVTTIAYTTFGEQASVTRHSVSVSGAPENGVFWSVREIADKMAGDAQSRTLTMSYDTQGRKTEARQSSRTYFNRVTGQVESAEPVTRYAHNTFGEVVYEAVRVETFGPAQWRETWHYFDLEGREHRTIDALGHHTERSYDAQGNLTQTIEYATSGSTGFADDMGVPPGLPPLSSQDRITRFIYNTLNQQIEVQRLGLRFTRAVGEGYEQVIRGRDEATTVATMTYDKDGRLETRTDALGNVTSTQYNAAGQVTQVTEPARVVAKRMTDPVLDPFRLENQIIATPVTRLTLNAFGQIVKQERDPGAGAGETVTTHTQYDFGGNAISSTDARGHTQSRQYDFAGRVIRQTQTHETRSIQASQTPSAQMTSQVLERRFAYDELGRQTEMTDVFLDTYLDLRPATLLQSGQRSVFNAFGEVIEERRIHGAAGAALSELTGPLVVKYVFDSTGRMIEKRGVSVTFFYYDLADGVVLQEQRGINPDGTITSLVRRTQTHYDALGRSQMQILPQFSKDDGSPIRPVVRQGYDRWGNVTSQSRGEYFDASDTLFSEQRIITFYEYNADNQLIAEHLPVTRAIKADGTSYNAQVTHELRYDLLGRAVQELDTVLDDQLTAANEAGTLRERSKHYNGAGQLTAETDYTSIKTQYVYDAHGNRVGTRNALGTVFVDQFDNNGNLTHHGVLRGSNGTTEYFNGNATPPPLAYVTLNQHEYDQANRRTGSAVAIRHDTPMVWSFTQLDERGYSRAQLNASGVLTRCEYDALGNKRRELDAKNNGYHARYSEADFTVGRIESRTIENGRDNEALSYTYDAFGQLRHEQRAATNRLSSYDFSYEYYDNGLLRKTENRLGPTQHLRQTAQVVEYGYTALGQRSVERSWLVRTLNNGSQQESDQRHTTTTYDDLGRMQTVAAPAALNPGRPTLGGLSYGYDELGNRRRISANYAGGELSERWFLYDKEGRTTLVDGKRENGSIIAGLTGTTLTYDALGRRETSFKYEKDNSHFTAFPEDPLQPLPKQTTTQWQQYRTELYGYNDLGYLLTIKQAVTQREKKATDTIGGVQVGDIRHLAEQTSAFEFLVENTYELRGTRTRSVQYTDFFVGNFFGPDVDSATVRLQGIATWGYRADGLVDRQGLSRSIKLTPTGFEADFDFSSSLFNHYDEAGVLRAYDYTPLAHITANRGLSTFRTDQLTLHYVYEYDTVFGGYKERTITVTASKPDNSDATLPGVGTTTNQYNVRGQLVLQTIVNPAETRTLSFKYDSEGHIIAKYDGVEGNSKGIQDYYYAGGRQVAMLGSGTLKTAEFSNDFTPISAAYPGTSPGSHVVDQADTLAGIAQSVWGDAQLWYLIADANSLGFGPTAVLSGEVGKTYRMPNVVTHRNNANTSMPYSSAAIIGNSTPVPGVALAAAVCDNTQWMKLGVIIAVAGLATYATAGALAPITGKVVAGVIGGAVGSLASQDAAIILDVQQGFSGRQLAGAAIAGGLIGLAATVQGTPISSAATGGLDGFGNLAQNAVLGTLGNIAAGVKVDPKSALIGLGTQLAVHGGLGSSFAAANTQHFAWGSALEAIAANALNPQTGWIFNARSRDWATIAGQAVGAFTGVAVNGVISAVEARHKAAEARLSQHPQPVFKGSAKEIKPTARIVTMNGMSWIPGPVADAEREAKTQANLKEIKSYPAGSVFVDADGDIQATVPIIVDPRNYLKDFQLAVAAVNTAAIIEKSAALARTRLDQLVTNHGSRLAELNEIIKNEGSQWLTPSRRVTSDPEEIKRTYENAVNERQALIDAYNPGMPHSSSLNKDDERQITAVPPGGGPPPGPRLTLGLSLDSDSAPVRFPGTTFGRLNPNAAANMWTRDSTTFRRPDTEAFLLDTPSGDVALGLETSSTYERFALRTNSWSFSTWGQLPGFRGFRTHPNGAVFGDLLETLRVRAREGGLLHFNLTGMNNLDTLQRRHLQTLAGERVSFRTTELEVATILSEARLYGSALFYDYDQGRRTPYREGKWYKFNYNKDPARAILSEADLHRRGLSTPSIDGLRFKELPYTGDFPPPRSGGDSGLGRRGGPGMEGVISGATTLYSGLVADDAYATAGGAAQTLGGGLLLAGAASRRTALSTLGGRAGWLGAAITAPVIAGDIYNDFSSGSGTRIVNGVLKIGGALSALGFAGQYGYDLLAIQTPAYLAGVATPGIYNSYGVPHY